ncbi:phenylacetate--CoA ligase family protein [Halobacteriovorax sp. HLS]|uniref:phenylacetate--CoA ligase family protein n=1 Tax=Halobacteriovorax sp. HLS TaxID=2234000 RepID=UPI000FDB4DCD|nr:AMP-binding protein [Halobacteriovorax sp. HLS]
MSSYSFSELLEFVREKSPYYKNLYSELPTDVKIEQLPITDQEVFWNNNSFHGNSVMTDRFSDGVVFKSGGTTGNPKFSIFTKSEWDQFTTDFGKGMDKLKMKDGDRCANLFYSGDLYASFLFINKCVEKMKTSVTQFPVTGQTDVEETLRIIKEYDVNVLLGVPTSLINLTSHCNVDMSHVDQIYYGGEPLFEDQKEILLRTFPNAYISSIGYASVDGGQLGYVDDSCSLGEHRVFETTIMEIVDEDTGEIIKEVNRVGKLVFTNLTRKLMPIIKYPVGDMASWTEVGTKFKLLGRSDEGARVGPITINRDDILSIFRSLDIEKQIQNFQMIIDRNNSKDFLKLVIGSADEESLKECLEKLDLIQAFYKQRKMYLTELEKGLVEKFCYEVVNIDKLTKNPRTGKLRLVIDKRHN